MTHTDEEFKERTRATNETLEPLRKEIESLRREEKSSLVFHLRSIDVKLDSLVVQVIGISKDVMHLKDDYIKQCDLVHKHEADINTGRGSLNTIKWAVVALVIPITTLVIAVFH